MIEVVPTGKQEMAVLKYMTTNAVINSVIAFEELKITRLAAVVFNLKKKGVPIESAMINAVDGDGNKTRWKNYWLVK